MWQGRLFDLYPNDEGRMVVWLKTESGEAIRLTDRWLPSLYVRFDRAKAKPVLKEIGDLVQCYSFCLKFAEPSEAEPTRVLRLSVPHRNLVGVAEKIEESVPYGSCSIYNADVTPGQSYLYEHDLFPLAKVRVSENQGRLEWEVDEDSTESTDYDTSFLKVARVTVYSEGDNRLGKFSVPIARIDVESDGVSSSLNQGSEADKILGFVETIKELDPDIVVTDDGDSFTLPYIFHRAEANQLGPLVLGRDDNISFVPPKSQGRSYVSYGKVMYRAPTLRLYGRVHLDESNTFMLAECGPEGLFEVARTCRIPLHEASRGSIGKCMSSLQFYEAHRNNILVPWRSSNAEHFKDAVDLLVADRGGFIFEPVVGLHENVGEIDFNSLYPNIMQKFNLSGETVLCKCCPDSPVRVPELGYHVCVRRKGIVPSTLELLLKKRARYKELMREARDEAVRNAYNTRQAALKWILVYSFGFLGYRNAKFGRIDSHIAVCAFARKILLDATRIAERRGFRVLHGIVDSLWLKREGAREEDYAQLCQEIEGELGFRVSFEGIYRWIAFLPSKVDNSTPVLNRYFGVFRDGKVKFRGIEARRRDTPRIIALCQMRMLNSLARGESIDNAKRLVPEALESLTEYARAIKSGHVPLSYLLVERQLSKRPSQYLHKTPQAEASRLLVGNGMALKPDSQVPHNRLRFERRRARRAHGRGSALRRVQVHSVACLRCKHGARTLWLRRERCGITFGGTSSSVSPQQAGRVRVPSRILRL